MNPTRQPARIFPVGTEWRAPVVLALLLAGPFAVASEQAGAQNAGVPPRPTTEPDRIAAFVSIAPQSYFAERVGAGQLDVRVLVGTGQSPHTFEPTPRQMARLSGADVYFTVGLPFERQLVQKARVLNPDLVVVDTTVGIDYRAIDGNGQAGHREGGFERGGGDGAVGLPDPHVWLDPARASKLAGNMCDALVELSPERASLFRAGLEGLTADLADLDGELRESLAPLDGGSVYVFHPAFGYFTDAYGLRQVAVETSGMEPGARALAALMERAVREGVCVVFVQPQFSTKSAEALAREIGGAVVPIDPLAADYIANLRSIARAVAAALREEEG